MRNYRVRFINENCEISVPCGTTVLQAQIRAGLHPDAPCGGKGSCGKCAVDVRKDGEAGWKRMLACCEKVTSDVEVRTLQASRRMKILAQADAAESAWNPWVNVGKNDFNGWVVAWEDLVMDVLPDGPDAYMAAFDIGTTTIAGYLISIAERKTVAAASMLNPQVQYGADVIARADYVMKNGPKELTSVLRDALNDMIDQLCSQACTINERIYAVSAVGNTCMHHLLIGADIRPLVVAPYQPSVRGELIVRAEEYGIFVHRDAPLMLLPVIAGFVGADTVACMVSRQWNKIEKRTLLIDIGTNGEMVLGNKERRIACSTAAGPALEGAKIQCGMRGEDGAVDHVWLENGKLTWHTIGNAKPRGICGSGLVDMIAVLLEIGVMDETGRILSGNMFEFGDTGVVLTQKDIREVQLAKAAIAAGIRLMARKMGIMLDDIEEVLIAGAFGSYMNPDSACRIGLIPSELRDKIRIIGNAAGDGAQRVLKDKNAWQEAISLAESTEFLELASMPEFQDTFVDELEFPE